MVELAHGTPCLESAAGSAARRHVFEEEKAGFAANYHVPVSVAVNIYDSNLHAAACSCAIVENMPLPSDRPVHHPALVPVDSQRFVGARVVVVRVIALAGD